MIVSTPVTAQTTSSQPDEPTNRAMSAETMKTPEPIIEPATSMVESSNPRPRMNFSSFTPGDCAVITAHPLTQRCACDKQGKQLRVVSRELREREDGAAGHA